MWETRCVHGDFSDPRLWRFGRYGDEGRAGEPDDVNPVFRSGVWAITDLLLANVAAAVR